MLLWADHSVGGILTEPERQATVADLLALQRGYWYTRSPKINDVLSTYAGSAYAVMALHACGEIR
jgi:hypothetical protein